MLLRAALCGIAVSSALAGGASACVLLDRDDRYFDQSVRDSLGVRAAADCSFVNGGVHDAYSFGPARDLGDGRVYQSRNDDTEVAMVSDCNAREVSLLRGPGYNLTSCLSYANAHPLFGPEGVLELSEGSDLYELEAIARDRGAQVLSMTEEFFEGAYGRPLEIRDYVDTMCGCRIFYPDSPGAQQ